MAQTGKLLVWQKSWVDKVHHPKIDRECNGAASRWHAEGILEIVETDGDFTEYVAQEVVDLIAELPSGVELLAYDRAMAEFAVRIWERNKLTLQEIPQGAFMDEGIAFFVTEVQHHDVRHGDCPLLSFAVFNAPMERTPGEGLRKIMKGKAYKEGVRIDPYIAVLCACQATVAPEALDPEYVMPQFVKF